MTQMTVLLEEEDAEALAEYLDMYGGKEFDSVVKALLAALPYTPPFELHCPSWASTFIAAGGPLSESLGKHDDTDCWWALRKPPKPCTWATGQYWGLAGVSELEGIIAYYRHRDQRRETDRSKLD